MTQERRSAAALQDASGDDMRAETYSTRFRNLRCLLCGNRFPIRRGRPDLAEAELHHRRPWESLPGYASDHGQFLESGSALLLSGVTTGLPFRNKRFSVFGSTFMLLR